MDPKKYPSADVHSKQTLFFALSLVITLSLVVMAFEWKTEASGPIANKDFAVNHTEELLDVPATVHLPPPPPRVVQPKIIEIPDEEEIKENIQVVIDQEMVDQMPEETIHVANDAADAEDTDEIFLVVESPAQFPGGQLALNEYFQKNLKYPYAARRQGIEGRVYVSAVIEKDGSVSTVQVMRGIGGGCDEESVRLIQSLPRWNAAKQRGHPVRCRVVFPIIFKF